MKLIGQGSFSKVYQKDKNTVLIYSNDPIKECLSWDFFPSSRLFPKVERIDYLDDGRGIYEMPFYPRVTSLKNTLKPSQYESYKELRRVFQYSSTIHINNKYDGYTRLFKAFKTIKKRHLRETMLQALDACSNYGPDIGFEISPRNVAVKNGNLILLDCFFMIGKLEETRKNKRS